MGSMNKYVFVLIWPAGIALILAGAYLMARKAAVGGDAARAGAREAARRHSRQAPGVQDAMFGGGQLILVAAVGALVAFGVLSLLGVLVVAHGLIIDRPIFTWMQTHQVHAMTALMNRLTKIGDTWTTWGAAAASAVCLAAAFREKRWLPPVAVAFAIFVDHYTTLALRHEFHRLGPPTSPLGTYPSGGVDRTVFLLGLIAYLLWHEFSRRRRTAIWAAAVIAALTFNEVYSRIYLSKHWTTDALSGVLYGALLLAAFIVAIRLVPGSPPVPVAEPATTRPGQSIVSGRPPG